MKILPTLTDGTPYYEFSVPLDGVTFLFEFIWNDRQACWFYNLKAADDTPLLMGRKVVLDLPMITRFKSLSLPAGDLVARDTTGAQIPPSLTDLGDRVILYYVTVAELEAIYSSK
jgi:hypothetical protein